MNKLKREVKMKTNRRQFLKNSTKILAAGAISTAIVKENAEAAASPGKKVKLKKGGSAELSFRQFQDQYVKTGFYPPTTYLLIDDLYVDKMDGLKRTVTKAQKSEEPILKPDKPWEDDYVWCHGGLLYDESKKLFRLYYHYHSKEFAKSHPEVAWASRVGCAESEDCVNWHKPNIGVVKYNGSKKNNIVDFPPYGGSGPLGSVLNNPVPKDGKSRFIAMGMTRFKTPAGEKPNHCYSPQRKRGLYRPPRRPDEVGISWALIIYDSVDGFVWKARPEIRLSNTLCTDNVFCHGYDEDLDAWLLTCQANARYKGPTNNKFRTIGVSIARDLDKIPYPQVAMTPDSDDPPFYQFNHMCTGKVSGGYVGTLTDFQAHKGDTNEVQLAFSRDYRVWGRPAGREYIIPGGDVGSWDEMNVHAYNPVTVGDEVYIIYHATPTGNGAWYYTDKGGKREYMKIGKWGGELPNGRLNYPYIGLAKLKRDRWAAIEPTDGSGVLQTQRMYWSSQQLTINADAGGGSIRAELFNPDYEPIKGFTAEDSIPFKGDSLNHQMAWKDNKQLPASVMGSALRQGHPGRLLGIRFYIDNAKLYSFTC